MRLGARALELGDYRRRSVSDCVIVCCCVSNAWCSCFVSFVCSVVLVGAVYLCWTTRSVPTLFNEVRSCFVFVSFSR